jgi:class 3 adenylate cyclase
MALGSALRRAGREGRELPSGTVSLLLTDVEASSASWDADADATDTRLRALDDVLRLCVARNNGRLIKSRGEGDSGFAVFHRASDAILAAAELQRSLHNNALLVRAAVHTGEIRVRGGDYYGVAPNRAARLRNLAHGGQIVVSRVSADLAEAELPDEVTLFQLGTFRIRDWPRSAQVFGVRAPGLQTEFPPLRVLGDSSQALMTIVSVDAVDSSSNAPAMSDAELVGVQRSLGREIRKRFDANRGTFLKLLGDGCMAAFDSPVAAVEFGRSLIANVTVGLRVVAAPGIVELVGDDLAGRILYTVFELSKGAPVGRIVGTRALVDLLTGQGLEFEALDGAGEVYTLEVPTTAGVAELLRS